MARTTLLFLLSVVIWALVLGDRATGLMGMLGSLFFGFPLVLLLREGGHAGAELLARRGWWQAALPSGMVRRRGSLRCSSPLRASRGRQCALLRVSVCSETTHQGHMMVLTAPGLALHRGAASHELVIDDLTELTEAEHWWWSTSADELVARFPDYTRLVDASMTGPLRVEERWFLVDADVSVEGVESGGPWSYRMQGGRASLQGTEQRPLRIGGTGSGRALSRLVLWLLAAVVWLLPFGWAWWRWLP